MYSSPLARELQNAEFTEAAAIRRYFVELRRAHQTAANETLLEQQTRREVWEDFMAYQD